MAFKGTTQKLRFHQFGVDSIDGASVATPVEFDSAGYSSGSVYLTLGAADASEVTVFSVHASDTSGFSPGAGNKIGEVTTLPDADAESVAVHLTNLTATGRYINIIATVADGASASDVAVVGVFFPSEQSPINAAQRGLIADTTV